MATKKLKYIIIKGGVCLKGTTVTPVGEKVDLTAEKAKALIGKVRLLDEYEAENKPNDVALTKENVTLTDTNDKLVARIAELEGVNNAGAKTNKKLVKDNAALVKTNDQLTEQLGKLTEQLTAKAE